MYGQLLRLSDFRGGATWDEVIRLAQLGLGNDPEGYRREFIDLVRVAQSVCGDRRSEYPAPEPVPHSAPDAAPRSVSSAVSAPASAPGGRPVRPGVRIRTRSFRASVSQSCLRTADLATQSPGRRDFSIRPRHYRRAWAPLRTGCPAGRFRFGRFQGFPVASRPEDLSLSVTLRSRTATVRSRRMPPANCPP